MSCTISGRVGTATAAGGTTGQSTKLVYLLPSRTDFEFSLDGGTVWQPWEGDPNLKNGPYAGAITATTSGSGAWSFVVPWTDSALEVQLPGGAPVPGLLWNIIDPNTASGPPRVIYGATPELVVASAKTTKQLISLGAPNTWLVGSVTYTAVPVGPRRFVTVSFTSASTTAAISMADIGTASWKFGHGIESDDTDLNFYTIRIPTQSKTSTAATVLLSDVPPAGKTVRAHIEVYV